MNYRVKVNELYFARFDDVEIVMVLDSAPGFIEGSRLFPDRDEAQAVADIISGIVVDAI